MDTPLWTRDLMLATLSNVWWPRLHQEVVAIARSCPQCRESGKNIKFTPTQKEIGKLPKCVENGNRTLRPRTLRPRTLRPRTLRPRTLCSRTLRPRTLRPKQTLRPNVNYAQGNYDNVISYAHIPLVP